MTQRNHQRLRLVSLAAAAAAVVLLAGCGSEKPVAQEPKRLNTEQAQALAIMRFQNFNKRVLHVKIDVPAKPVDFHAEAVLDLRDHVGFGEYTTTNSGTSDVVTSGVIAWSQDLIATTDGGDFKQLPPDSAWTQRPIGQSTAVDAMLLMALQLGGDRPENPVLLQQSSARLLRTEKHNGKPVWVISGPAASGADVTATNGAEDDANSQTSRTTYWIDKEGMLSRFEAKLGGSRAALAVVAPSGAPDTIPPRIRSILRLKGPNS